MNQLITVTASGCLVLAAALDRGLRGVGGGGGGEGGGVVEGREGGGVSGVLELMSRYLIL